MRAVHCGKKKQCSFRYKFAAQRSKTFEEIQALYEKVKRFDESFTAVGSIEDERRIKEMNEGVKDPDQKSLKKRLKEEDTTKVHAKVDVTEHGTKKRKGGHIKMIARKKGKDINQMLTIVTWRLYEACGVCILEFEDGTVIHMLVERRYPLSKDLLQRMLDLGLELEREELLCPLI
ncbi:hypothetical protein Tco_0149183 [Tanacetum coccineum]